LAIGRKLVDELFSASLKVLWSAMKCGEDNMEEVISVDNEVHLKS
jgi:hypothetical protein